ncbi:MAG: AarF/UbiB family protein [Gemmataceae bacterium]
MFDWSSLIDEDALRSVVPDCYAHFLKPISGALAVFLGGLPPPRQAAILAAQAALPADAPAAQRVATLARSCPALHKLGQVLARDIRLSADLRVHLQELESLPPAVPFKVIQDRLLREIGPLDRAGVTLLPPAVAEASVAVVVAYRDDRAPEGAPHRHGVFKLLKPGVVEHLAQDLDMLERVGSYLDQRCDEFKLPHLDYQESFQQVRDKLRHEIRFDLEQRHLTAARQIYRDDPRVHVPALFERCTPRLTAMERLSGGKITDRLPPTAAERRRLARVLIEALLARPFFLRSNQAIFHGDPHAGNLFLTAEGRVGILDWSLAYTLEEQERVTVVQMLLGAVTLHAERIIASLLGLVRRGRVDRPALDAVVHAWLARVRGGQFPGFAWLTGMLDEAVQRARLGVGGELMVFRKTLHTLEGVLADLGADVSPDRVLIGEFVRQLVTEWPVRWLAPPASRAFATRLSNADLLGVLLSLPCAAARLWLDRVGLQPA